MSQMNPRRASSSRATTARPRKIAGRAEPTTEESTAEEVTAGQSATEERVVDEPHVVVPQEAAPDPTVATDEPGPKPPSMFAGKRVTRGLVIALALLVVVLLLQGGWFLYDGLRSPATVAKDGVGQIDVPADRPVGLNQTDADAAVDAAAKAAVAAFTVDYRKYDADIAKAADLMTDRFAVQFKNTAADSKAGFLKTKTSLSSKVVAQGVVKANTVKAQALLFFDEYVVRGSGKNRRITYTPFKVLVTMVHTDHGWLVDGLDTK